VSALPWTHANHVDLTVVPLVTAKHHRLQSFSRREPPGLVRIMPSSSISDDRGGDDAVIDAALDIETMAKRATASLAVPRPSRHSSIEMTPSGQTEPSRVGLSDTCGGGRVASPAIGGAVAGHGASVVDESILGDAVAWVRRSPIAWLLLAGAATCWATVWIAASRTGEMTGGMPVSAAMFVLMWVLMMAAMMLPALAPVAALYASVVDHDRVRDAKRSSPVGLVVGYLTGWALVGVGALLTVRGATRLATADPSIARVMAAAAIAGCGLYQLTPLKEQCLARCRSPLGLALRAAVGRGRFRDIRAGIYNAGWCIGCCWTLMLALMLLGAMELGWMVAFTVILTLEKTWRHGSRVATTTGVARIALGGAVLADPTLASILTTNRMVAM
jgi:predicted metal-binding membrane protein